MYNDQHLIKNPYDKLVGKGDKQGLLIGEKEYNMVNGSVSD